MSPDEENVMKMTIKETLLRAADIVERITSSDVLEAQAEYLRRGWSLEKVSKIDRAAVAVAQLRACAAGKVKA